MEHTSDDSNSSVGSYRDRNSPLNFSKTQCQMSTKATAFSIDALIGRKRTLAAQLQKSALSSSSAQCSEDDADDAEECCNLAKRKCCDSPTQEARVSRSDPVAMAPIGSYSRPFSLYMYLRPRRL